jgi:hypothetical protein
MKRKLCKKNGRTLVRMGYGLALLLGAAPALAQAPADLLVCKEKGFTLTSLADAAGASAVTYTWYENGTPINNSNTAALTIPAGSKTPGAYSYARKAANTECAEAWSNTYTVVVLQSDAPTISVAATPVCEGADVAFTVAPAANTTYTWSVVEGESGNPSGGANSTYTLTAPPHGTKQVQVTATTAYLIDGKAKTCISGLSAVAEAVVGPRPVVTPTATAAQCGGGAMNLGVVVTVNSSALDEGLVAITWYDDAAGTTEVATGAAYTTPFLYASQSYYVGATVTATGCASAALTQVDATVNLYEGEISGQED